MEEWKFVLVDYGAQFAMMVGMTGMLRLCVNNWDIMDVSLP